MRAPKSMAIAAAMLLGCATFLIGSGAAAAPGTGHSFFEGTQRANLRIHHLATPPSDGTITGREMSRLRPLAPGAPHTERLVPRGSAPRHDLAGAPLASSSNWSGLVETGTGATFSEVAGQWTVPAVPSSASDEASSTWIGIDGTSSSTLIQTGTNQNTGPGFGGKQYDAWIEMLPGNEQVIMTSPTTPAPVEPGDTMTGAVFESSSNLWTIELRDVTQSWSFLQQYSYSTPGVTAEWIEEATTVNGSVATLPNYGSTSFTNLQIAGTGLSLVAAYPLYLESASGAIVSYPASFNSATGSFSVFYGSPPPQVNSVSPDEGATSGGTSVTLGGNFVTGVSSVDIGGVFVPFAADVAAGTVTAVTPSHSVGRVDMAVTTPGGTSQLSSADQFSYVASAASPVSVPTPVTTHGYWLVGSDGGIFSFGSAQFYGSTGGVRLQRPVVGIVPTSDRSGYWLDASDGGVFAFGDSGFFGSIPGLGIHPAGSRLPNSLGGPIVGMVSAADGHGYFMVASDGGVFAFGDARFAGSCPGIGGCVGSAVAVMPDASGNGYWLVTSLGNVYAFGDAANYGFPGPQGARVTAAVRTPDGRGYWILFANGAVFSYGDADFFGSPLGQLGGVDPATAIFSTADGDGYSVASAAGAVDPFGDAPDDGSMAGRALNGAVIAATGW